MAEGTLTETIRKIVAKAEPYIPQVPKPKKKIPLQQKILWTSGCLVIYLVMGQTPLFGATAPEFDFLAFARVIFASAQGSLVELGIGPIVTGGLLMQLLRGSDILKFDFKNPAERGVFQTATKLVTYIVIVAESIVYAVLVCPPPSNFSISSDSKSKTFLEFSDLPDFANRSFKSLIFIQTFVMLGCGE